jgi:hypothetical protein
MPRIDLNEGLERRKAGHFGFSAVKREDLGASEYTLVTIVDDCSGSTSGFTAEMEAAVKEIVKACSKSEKADNLMIRLIRFDTQVMEVHGYKLLNQCAEGDYTGVLTPGGATALYDATIDALEASYHFAEELDEQEDILSNGIVFVITDGYDNSSSLSPSECKKALKKAILSEKLESLVSVLIAVAHGGTTKFVIVPEAVDRHTVTDFQGTSVDGKLYSKYDDASQACKQASTPGNKLKVVPVYDPNDQLSVFDREAGFTAYLPLEDSSKGTLAKLAQFVSKSISSQSQQLGSGKPSESVAF